MTVALAVLFGVPALLVARATRRAPDAWDGIHQWTHRQQHLARACTRRLSAGKPEELS